MCSLFPITDYVLQLPVSNYTVVLTHATISNVRYKKMLFGTAHKPTSQHFLALAFIMTTFMWARNISL